MGFGYLGDGAMLGKGSVNGSNADGGLTQEEIFASQSL
jgi:hypothetical protein